LPGYHSDLSTQGVSAWQFIKKSEKLKYNQATFHFRSLQVMWSQMPRSFWRAPPIRVPIAGNGYWLTGLSGIRVGTLFRFELHLLVTDFMLITA
jgi:hypothetical protein